MKITIAYLPEEAREADLILRFTIGLTGAKVRKGNSHPPFKHIYMTTRKPETPCNSKKNS